MSGKCCIPYCTSPPSMLHPLPLATGMSPEKGREIWFRYYNNVENCFRSTHPLFLIGNTTHDKICPLHYEDYDLTNTEQTLIRRHLGAIPTIFPWSPEWIQMASVQERHPVPSSHFELLVNDSGMLLVFCFMCEYSTKSLYHWDAHMKQCHFNKETNQTNKRRPARPDELDNPSARLRDQEPLELVTTKRQKLNDCLIEDDASKDENPDYCIIVAEKGNGSELKDQPSTVDPTGSQQRKPSAESSFSLRDKETRILREEAELRRQLDHVAQSMATCDKAMQQLRMDHAERLETLRQEVKRLEGEEGECQSTIADLAAKKQRLADLSARKRKVDGAITLMMEGDPLSPDQANPDIPEEFKPALQRLRAESSALEKELCAVRQEEKQRNSLLKKNQAILSAAKKRLSLARKEFSQVSKTMEPSFQDQMQQLTEAQRNRISFHHELEKRLADLAFKRRLVQVEINDAMNPYLQ